VKNEDLLSTDLALKIAAIREKFEETGIQLSEKLILQIIEINIIQ
jgi:8-oxo-dGTP pyrophosphatase MutT (NUDIX family)